MEVQERIKWEMVGTKMLKRRKRDQETTAYLVSVLVNAHPLKIGPEAPKLFVIMEEAACI